MDADDNLAGALGVYSYIVGIFDVSVSLRCDFMIHLWELKLDHQNISEPI